MTYSQVRIETHIARDYMLISLANNLNVVDLWHDNSDLIQVTLRSQQKIMITLVDDYISLPELQKLLAADQAKNHHSLFIFWADMLLPDDGERFLPQDWMAALLALYGDKLYAYEVSSKAVYIFPIYFELQDGHRERYIRWGEAVKLSELRPDFVHVESPFLNGQFRMADFGVPHSQRAAEEAPAFTQRTAMQAYYQVFSLSPDASLEEVRRAYRELARQYHPDLNTSPEATQKMQEINQAYAQIMAQGENGQ